MVLSKAPPRGVRSAGSFWHLGLKVQVRRDHVLIQIILYAAVADVCVYFAILVIATHAAPYIFTPPRRLGEGGLYRYRRLVYTLWIVLPVIAASLAFTNPTNAYVTSGTFCYLPTRPFWHRLALAWIARYLLFLIICGIYLAIYIYVHIKFKDFENVSSEGSTWGNSSMGDTVTNME